MSGLGMLREAWQRATQVPPLDGRSEVMVKNFHFEEPGRIARSGYPESAEEIDWLFAQGIRTVVSLHPVPPQASARMEELGIRWLPFLLEDWSRGVPEGLGTVLQAVSEAADQAPVLIHCQ